MQTKAVKTKRKQPTSERAADRHRGVRAKIVGWRPSQDELDWLAAHPELGDSTPARVRAVLRARMAAEPIVCVEVPKP